MLRVCIVCLLLCSCTSPGASRASHTRTWSDATAIQAAQLQDGVPTELPPGWHYEHMETNVVQPNPSDEAATVDMGGEDWALKISTGTGGALAAIARGLASPWIYLVAGIVLTIAGGVIWLAKSRAAKLATVATGSGGVVMMLASHVPRGTGLLLMCMGAVVSILPWFLSEWGWVIGVSAIGAVLILAAKYIYNLMNEDDDEKQH